MLKTTKEPDSSRLLIREPMAYTLSTVFCLHDDEKAMTVQALVSNPLQ
jgi:hypothetical protein